ncbi:hypothetical protein AH332_14250 [Salmonella enterica subsp. salamae]|nr:hypothetical protein [Salmonella enterica subsp. salamae]EDW4021185.1 hypothetical protein [Salmonella enterica subsp. salamae]
MIDWLKKHVERYLKVCRLQVMKVEGTFTVLCQEYELLLYAKARILTFTTLDERLTDVKANENSARTLPHLDDFTLTARRMVNAEKSHLVEATQRFYAPYGEGAPPSKSHPVLSDKDSFSTIIHSRSA